MRRALPSFLALAVLLAGCGQQAGQRAERRLLRRFGGVGPALGSPARQPNAADPEEAPAATVAPADENAEAVSWPEWAALLLPRLGAPVCPNNVVAVVAWAAQENTTAGWNPLATTFDMTGSTRFNSHGVRNYESVEQGLDATVITLEQGLSAHGYGAIIEALQGCAPAMETARAIRASSWCAGCAEGRYVTGIVRAISAALQRGG